jgi:hypothetical protein
MIERGTITEQPAAGPNGETPSEQTPNGTPGLEQRVRRLEDAVATLQDTRPLEERITERVSRRLSRNLAQTIQASGTVGNSGRRLLPAALDLIRSKAGEAERRSAAPSGSLPRPWLLFDAYTELRTMVWMFLDSRYRPTWAARIAPLVLLALVMTSWIWLPGTTFLPTSLMTIIDKTVDIALAFLAFKILHREARRYRELVADLPSPEIP